MKLKTNRPRVRQTVTEIIFSYTKQYSVECGFRPIKVADGQQWVIHGGTANIKTIGNGRQTNHLRAEARKIARQTVYLVVYSCDSGFGGNDEKNTLGRPIIVAKLEVKKNQITLYNQLPYSQIGKPSHITAKLIYRGIRDAIQAVLPYYKVTTERECHDRIQL